MTPPHTFKFSFLLVTMLSDPAAYFMAYDALTHSGGASPSRFNSQYCDNFTNQTDPGGLLANDLKALFLGAVRLTTPIDSPGPRSLVEPPLMVRM